MISTLVLDAPASARSTTAPSAAPLRGVGYGSTAYLVIFALGVLALMFVLGGLQSPADLAWAAAFTLAPAALALRLTFTSQADRQQYVARLMACALMLPLLVLMWASSQTLTEAPVVVGLAFVLAGALHLAAFVGATVTLASRTTRLMPAVGVAPVGAERLLRRLASLGVNANDSAPLRLRRKAPTKPACAALATKPSIRPAPRPSRCGA